MSAQRLVLIHGRAQENKDSIALKKEWLDAFRKGLAQGNLDLPLGDDAIRFPYYGDTLHGLVSGAATITEVVVRGDGTAAGKDEQRFQARVAMEIKEKLGISDDEVAALMSLEAQQRGVLNWEWVQALLQVIDNKVPGASAASVALATRDVYQYLRAPGIRDKIETGVRQAMVSDVPTVVVSHSLGTVVAYNLLRREGVQNRWKVPLFVTLGSPLGVTAIKQALAPIEFPQCVDHWFNAMDDRDVVALYPLTADRFDVDPAIENKTDVRNHTSNNHGIAGYLEDAVVARRIRQALG